MVIENLIYHLFRLFKSPDLDNKASNLSLMSQKYRKDTRYLNISSTYAKAAAGGIILLVFVLYFWVL